MLYLIERFGYFCCNRMMNHVKREEVASWMFVESLVVASGFVCGSPVS